MITQDREIMELEQAITRNFIDIMTEEERKDFDEQQEIINEMKAALKKKRNALSRQ